MKKWLIGIAAFVVIVVAVLLIVPFLIPTETYKGQIVERVKSATGRDLALNGPISLSILPSFALTVSDVVPRAWTALDVSLVQETAERTWAAVERAQAEEALRESMEWMRLAAAAARLYAWDLDVATGRLRISDEAQQVPGVDVRPDLRAGTPIVCHPDDEPRVQHL